MVSIEGPCCRASTGAASAVRLRPRRQAVGVRFSRRTPAQALGGCHSEHPSKRVRIVQETRRC